MKWVLFTPAENEGARDLVGVFSSLGATSVMDLTSCAVAWAVSSSSSVVVSPPPLTVPGLPFPGGASSSWRYSSPFPKFG